MTSRCCVLAHGRAVVSAPPRPPALFWRSVTMMVIELDTLCGVENPNPAQEE